jgi:photosystem II stability/assembly factor-like uncharacterized protein
MKPEEMLAQEMHRLASEATPQAHGWITIEKRIRRRRVVTFAAAGLAGAVAITAIAIVVPKIANRSTRPIGRSSNLAPVIQPTGTSRWDQYFGDPFTRKLAMIDNAHGWAIGKGGVFGTRDGHTWTQQLATKTHPLTIDAIDSSHAWASDETGVYATTDGASWNRIYKLVAHKNDVTIGQGPFRLIDFVSPNDGWAITDDSAIPRSIPGTEDSSIVGTTDGGHTWSAFMTGNNDRSFCRFDRNSAAAVMKDAIFVTHDGHSWPRVFQFPPDMHPRSIRCVQGTPDAWVVATGGVGLSHEAYQVWKTNDGGATWHWVIHDTLGSQPSNTTTPSAQGDAYVGPYDVNSHGALFAGFCGPCPIELSLTQLDANASVRTSTRLDQLVGSGAIEDVELTSSLEWLLMSDGTIWSGSAKHWTRQFSSPDLAAQ